MVMVIAMTLAGCGSPSRNVEKYVDQIKEVLMQSDLTKQALAEGINVEVVASGTTAIYRFTYTTQLDRDETADVQSWFMLIYEPLKSQYQSYVDQVQENECPDLSALKIEFRNLDETVIFSDTVQ